MRRQRRTLSAGFKAKVACEALEGEKTLAQIAKEHDLHVNQIYAWRNHAIENISILFEPKNKTQTDQAKEIFLLQAKIGQLTMEIDAIDKASGQSS